MRYTHDLCLLAEAFACMKRQQTQLTKKKSFMTKNIQKKNKIRALSKKQNHADITLKRHKITHTRTPAYTARPSPVVPRRTWGGLHEHTHKHTHTHSQKHAHTHTHTRRQNHAKITPNAPQIAHKTTEEHKNRTNKARTQTEQIKHSH